MKNRNIIAGLGFVLAAVVLMGSAMGFIPAIPWFKLFCGFIFLVGAIKGLLNREFCGGLFSLGIVAWIFEKELMIEHLVPFPLLVAAALLGIGLNMIIGKKHKVINIRYRSDDDEYVEGSIEDARVEEWSNDGRHVVLENAFNTTSKYVNAAAFGTANLENSFGTATVYFNNATIAGREATIDAENSFGRMNVYVPSRWRATISQTTAFGHVAVYGEPNRDMDAPHVIIKAESNFGDLNIFFE